MTKILLIFLILLSFPAQAQNKPSPVLVELFSSQGCPACPPADAYIKDLSESDGVIALACHVDYFPVPGDTLGKKFCTDRQSRYIRQINRKSHFTPQMMINGTMSEIGYERDAVTASILKARSERVQEILIRPKGSGVFDFIMPSVPVNGAADLWLAVYNKPQTVKRRGRSITYYNVIHHFLPLGDWKGSVLQRAVFPLISNDSAGFTIVAQDKSTGRIYAAGEYRL
jgi:hypothetical protein